MPENSFALILEKALNNPDTFLQNILPYLNAGQEQFKELANILQHGDVVSRQLISKLFIETTGTPGAKYLTENLDVDKKQLFIASAYILSALDYESAIEKLEKGIYAELPELVLPVIKAISMMPPSKQVSDALIRFYLNFSDETKLSASIRYLINQKQILVDEILKQYDSLDSERRMWALKFLSEANDVKALELFSRELDTEPTERGLYCIKGLGNIATDAAVEVLKKHMGHSEWFLRKRIAEALGATNLACAVEPLLSYLSDNFVQVQSTAVESLSKIGNLRPELLVNELKKAKQNVKINLIRVTGNLKNEIFLEPLIEILRDRSTLFFTIDSLGDLGFKKSERALRRLLKDDIWFNRLNALEALAKLQIEELTQIATESIQDENDMVRNAASRILSAQKKSANQ